MPTNRETGKDRWRRVPKDYFKERDRLQKSKLLLSSLALHPAAGLVPPRGSTGDAATSWKATDTNSLRANHGTLARVHAAWDNKCDACHVPFEPIDGRPLFASASTPATRTSDKLCMSCHAGPLHHASAIEAEVKGCAECHRDHQGRNASLVRLTDNECTRCHAEPEKHINAARRPAGTRSFEKPVSRFSIDGHPAFASDSAVVDGSRQLRDRGKLKFNHARHMMPGIVAKPGDTPYKVEDIPLAAERWRYQGTGAITDSVRLECVSCHHLDPSEVRGSPNPAIASASVPSGSGGRYYLPVRFEQDCRGCHLLTFDPSLSEVEAPHGVQPDQVLAFVKRTYAVECSLGRPESSRRLRPARPDSGEIPRPDDCPETPRRRGRPSLEILVPGRRAGRGWWPQ